MSGSASNVDEDVLQVANEITRYLEQREGAADTLEGLVRWWLLRQRLTETEQKVSVAVEHLCKQGVINKRVLADGTVLYVAAPQIKKEEN